MSPATSTATEERRSKHHKHQRAYRERKKAYVRALEAELQDLKQQLQSMESAAQLRLEELTLLHEKNTLARVVIRENIKELNRLRATSSESFPAM